MAAYLSCSLVLAASLAGIAPAAAAEPGDRQCQVEGRNLNLFRDREAIIASYERLPEGCLKTLFHDCSDAARGSLLDGGTAAVCSMGYEALLRRSFGGDFRALLVWWRGEGRAAAKR